jgi:hypothetical protein
MKKIIRLTESDLVRLVNRVINEQQEMTLQQYMDELLKDPVGFLNKLNTDEQFKNAYIKSYGPDESSNDNWYILQDTKLKHLFNNGVELSGQIRDRDTSEFVKNYKESNFNDFLETRQFILDQRTKGRDLQRFGTSPRLSTVKNGNEVAQSLNVPFGGDVVFK